MTTSASKSSAILHLVVDLLQLEAPDDIHWHHVGGSGDGGVDGISVDDQGRLRAVLQCKWHSNVQPDELAQSMRKQSGKGVRTIVAILHGKQGQPHSQPGLEFWNRKHIAILVEKHAAHLPIARTFGIV